jgi:signal transduction histidine kinase
MNNENYKYIDTRKIEKEWHQLAVKLNHGTVSHINAELRKFKEQYPKANLFWVNSKGQTVFMLPKYRNIPNQWTFQESMKFIQNKESKDLYTIFSPVGGDLKQGYIVFILPRSLTDGDGFNSNILFFMFMLFAFFSFLFFIGWFFYRLRKRLVQLENSMTKNTTNGIPHVIKVKKLDEIGRLEQAFNKMIKMLEVKQNQKEEEEELRKELIASISHDLRTPLTIIQGHTYALQQGNRSINEQKSLQVIENKVDDLSQLIDNLLAYTLLSAGKYPLHLQEDDIVKIIRTSLAQWYPIFEKHDFQIKIELLDEKVNWNIDPLWFMRILDNLFQNVIRHAKSGRYICVRLETIKDKAVILVKDKGQGFDHQSDEKGIGIGLSIISLMLEEMNLSWKIDSSSTGTRIYIQQPEAAQ